MGGTSDVFVTKMILVKNIFVSVIKLNVPVLSSNKIYP